MSNGCTFQQYKKWDCAENIQLHDLITLKEISYKAICMAEQYCPTGMLSEDIPQDG